MKEVAQNGNITRGEGVMDAIADINGILDELLLLWNKNNERISIFFVKKILNIMRIFFFAYSEVYSFKSTPKLVELIFLYYELSIQSESKHISERQKKYFSKRIAEAILILKGILQNLKRNSYLPQKNIVA